MIKQGAAILNPNFNARVRRALRARRFASAELRAIQDLRPRLGIRRALVERIKWTLELDGVDSGTMAAVARGVSATQAELQQSHRALASARAELVAIREALDAQTALTGAIATHLEMGKPGTPHLAAPAMVERMLATEHWLARQQPSSLRVSVIIPTRSRPKLLLEAIASVQAQSHPRWETIVVDDGSEDETQATLATIDDDRVRSVRTEGLGPPGARTVGLKAATGDVIAYLDDDNIMLPGWLASVAWAFSQFEDVDVLYGARVVEDETPLGSAARLPRLLFRGFDRRQLLEDNYIDASVIAHRAGLAEARWDPALAGIADWDLMIRLTHEKPALALPVPAVLYRTHAPAQLSGSQTARDATDRLRARLSASRR